MDRSANENLDLAALRIFKAVAECGGITRAAARLHRVQSNVTTRIQQLEARVGARLFHRRNRRLELSEDGRILLGYAERLLSLSAEAQQALHGGAPRGVFRLGSLESTAATRLPSVLARYHRDYPEVRVELVTGTTGKLVESVLEGEIEAAFVAEPFSADGLERQPVFTEELVVIAGPAYSRGGRARFAHAPVLAFAAGCSYRRRLEAWLAREGLAAERVMEYASYHAIVACVIAGGGIAVVPRSVLRALRLATRPTVHELPRDISLARTCLVWREGHRSGALDALQGRLKPR